MSTPIWDQWTNESAQTIQKMTYDELLKQFVGLWNDFTVDETGKTYEEYINRTPQDVTKQIMDEVEETIDYELKKDSE